MKQLLLVLALLVSVSTNAQFGFIKRWFKSDSIMARNDSNLVFSNMIDLNDTLRLTTRGIKFPDDTYQTTAPAGQTLGDSAFWSYGGKNLLANKLELFDLVSTDTAVANNDVYGLDVLTDTIFALVDDGVTSGDSLQAWDLSGNVIQTIRLDGSGNSVSPDKGFSINATKDTFLIVGGVGANFAGRLIAYELTSSGDLSTYSYIENNFLTNNNYYNGIDVKDNGTKLVAINDDANQVEYYTLSTPWRPTTTTQVSTFGIPATYDDGISISNDGTTIYLSKQGTGILKIEFVTAWDFASDSTQTYIDFSSSIERIKMTSDGLRFYYSQNTGSAWRVVNRYFSKPIYYNDGDVHVTNGNLSVDTGVIIVPNLTELEADKTVYMTSSGELRAKKHSHGFYYFEDSTTIFNVAVLNTWYHVGYGVLGYSIFNTGENNTGTTFINDTITLNSGVTFGHWGANFSLTLEGGTGEIIQVRLYNLTKSLPLPIKAEDIGEGNNDPITFNNAAYCTFCEDGDKIIMQARNVQDTDNFELRSAYIEIWLKHATNE